MNIWSRSIVYRLRQIQSSGLCMSRHRRGRTALFFIIHSYKYKLIIKGNEGLTEEFSKAWFFIISYYNYISLIKKFNEGLIEEHSSDVSLIYILWYYFANQIALWKRTDLGHISLGVIAGDWTIFHTIRLLISIFNTFFSSYQGHCVAIGEISLKYFPTCKWHAILCCLLFLWSDLFLFPDT